MNFQIFLLKMLLTINLFDEKPELEVIKAKFFKAKMGR